MFLLGIFHCKITVPFCFTMHIILFPRNLILSRNLKWLLEVEQMIISLYVGMPPTARDTLTLKATVSTLTTSPSFELFQFQVYPSFSKNPACGQKVMPIFPKFSFRWLKIKPTLSKCIPFSFLWFNLHCFQTESGQMKAGGNITVMLFKEKNIYSNVVAVLFQFRCRNGPL